MTRAEVGLTVTHRRYVPYSHAHYAGNLVDGAYSLAAFGDVATEMCIRTDGDEGLFASYSSVRVPRAGPRRRRHRDRGPPRAGRNPFPRDGVRGARRRPGRPRARRVRRRRARPTGGGDHRPWGRGGAPGLVTYRWRVPTPLRYAARPAAAVAAGLCLWLAFPEANLWWLAPVGVALLAGATLTAGARQGALLGLLAGLAFFVPVLSWSGVYVGALPWFALATLEALYIAAMSAVVGYAGRRLTAAGRTGTAYLVVPLAWVVQEWARGATPYGGFPWARLAFSQADSPLAHVARWLGAPGVTFAVAVVGTLLLAAVTSAVHRSWARAAGAAVVAVGARGRRAAGHHPAHRRARRDGRVRAGQRAAGGPRVQRPAPGRARQPRQRHRAARHAARPTTSASSCGRRTPPTSTRSATRTPPRRSTTPAAAVGVPLLIGAVLAEPPGHSSNVSLFYLPGVAEPQRYVKLHPVPFAEYIPSRAFFRMFTPMADLAGNFVAGHEIGIFRVPAAAGTTSHCRRSASRSPTTT